MDRKVLMDAAGRRPAFHLAGLLVLLMGLLGLGRIALGQEGKRTRNVVLITVDGLRHQELFSGLDRELLGEEARDLEREYGGATPQLRRRALMPFFWSELAPQGMILGHRARGSEVKVANPHRFSYPGYSELLTGEVLAEIDSNDPIRIPRPTVLEYVRHSLALTPLQVATFASWSVLNFIDASEEGSIFSNAGYQKVPDALLSAAMIPLNDLQTELLTPWDTVRHDSVTFHLALEYLRKHRPRLLYLALGETDDWAHEGRYDRVIQHIRLFDDYLRKLWATLQSMSQYRDQTTLIVTTDHGRGNGLEDWTRHGHDVHGAEFIWLAVVGPDTPGRGEVAPSPTFYQKEIAATLLRFFGLDERKFNPRAGRPISLVFHESKGSS